MDGFIRLNCILAQYTSYKGGLQERRSTASPLLV